MRGRESQVDKIVDKILSELPDDKQLRQAVLAKLNERILNTGATEGVTKIEGKQSRKKVKSKVRNWVEI